MENVDVYKYERYFDKKIDKDGYIDPLEMDLIINWELEEELGSEMSISEIINFVNSKEIDKLNIIGKDGNEEKYNYIKTYIEILKEKSIKLLYFIETMQCARDSRFDYSKFRKSDDFLRNVSMWLSTYDIDVDHISLGNNRRETSYGCIKYQDMYRLLIPLIENIKDLNQLLYIVDWFKDINIIYQYLLYNGMFWPSRSLYDNDMLVRQRGSIPLSDKRRSALDYQNYSFTLWKKEKVKYKKI